MPRDHDLIQQLRRWYDRPADPSARACETGPRFVELVGSMHLGQPLTSADQAHVDGCARCRATLELLHLKASTARDLKPARVFPFRRHRWPVVAGMASAAVIGIAVLLAVFHASSRRAEAAYLCDVARAGRWPTAGGLLGLLSTADEAATIEQNRTERDAALAAGIAKGIELWRPWTQLYRNLAADGRIDEALAEITSFVEFTREHFTGDDRAMHATSLFELAETQAAVGDWESAWKSHLESLEVRIKFTEWNLLNPPTDDRPHQRECAEASNVFPSLSALSTLAAARGDLALAWDYHGQAEAKLTACFEAECRHQGLPMPPGASLVVLCSAIAPKADGNTRSPIVKVREHYLRKARLHRLSDNLNAADLALNQGALIPNFPDADESRLDFNEPMERLRIALAGGNFADALEFALIARQHTGPREFGASSASTDGTPPPQPQIGVLARAELDFLHGVALAGVDRTDPRAIHLIDTALDTLDRIAASLPETDRERFHAAYAQWEEVRDHVAASAPKK